MRPVAVIALLLAWGVATSVRVGTQQRVRQEVSVARHVADGEEQKMTVEALISHGRHLFTWIWNARDGAGRPIVNRGDGPRPGADSTACAVCHHQPFGIAGGGGTRLANVLALDAPDGRTIVNRRATVGIFGAGFLEMVARQMTADLQAIRDRLKPGQSAPLVSKDVSFGTLARGKNGTWDTSGVIGLPEPSLATTGAAGPPDLIVRPFHAAGAAVSIRQFSSDAFQLHHGIQSAERAGRGKDPDGDGFVNELTRADATAVAIFSATLAVPGRVIPNDPAVEAAVRTGEQKFEEVGCARCHVPALPLDRKGWIFTEPNPFNPPGNLRPGEAPAVTIDLTSDALPQPRLKAVDDVVWVPAYTDFRLHDITSGTEDPDREPLDQHQSGSAAFKGNGRFITKRLWGAASEPPFYHNGRYRTLREAILAHAGEAIENRKKFEALPASEQEAIVTFLNTLRVLPPGTRHSIVDERGQPKAWPAATPSSAPQPAGHP